MRKILLAALCASLSLVCGAQAHRFSVTLNPFSFAERDGGFTPGIGYNITNRLAVFADLGVIFYETGSYTGDVIETNRSAGYKLKPALRYYWRENAVQQGGFVEVEGMYKHVAYDAINPIAVLDNNGNFDYSYIGGYTVKKDVYGLNFKLGNRSFFGEEKRMGLDMFIGVGTRTKNFATSGLPPAVQFNDNVFSDPNLFSFFWRSGKTVSFPAGIKLFYTF